MEGWTNYQLGWGEEILKSISLVKETVEEYPT